MVWSGRVRVVTNRKSQVVPYRDIRSKKVVHTKQLVHTYAVGQRWPGAATGGPILARQ